MSAALRHESTPDEPSGDPTRHTIVERLSHELRTPLNSVIGFSRVLQGNRTGNQRPADLAMLEAIRANGERLLALVEDLVALSVSSPVIELPTPPLVNLANITEDVVEKFNKLAGHTVPAAQVASIRDAVLNLEKLPDAGQLARLMTKA